MRLKNGRSEISVDATHKGGGWYDIEAKVNGKPRPTVTVKGSAAAEGYLTERLDKCFVMGYRLVDSHGRMQRAVAGGILEAHTTPDGRVTVRLPRDLVATIAEGIAGGADPAMVTGAIQEVRGIALSPMERQQLLACAISTKQRFTIEGKVNQRWYSPPKIDKALLSRLVPA